MEISRRLSNVSNFWPTYPVLALLFLAQPQNALLCFLCYRREGKAVWTAAADWAMCLISGLPTYPVLALLFLAQPRDALLCFLCYRREEKAVLR